ncbi:cystatin [Centroberyx affinis]|uniref:cystatin n=1 Tax=Centroberyx affinis TaxID=166261 RepID=UPI003A5BD7A4
MAVFFAVFVLLGFALRAGGEKHADSAEIQAADFAVGLHNRLSGDAFAYKVLAILSHAAQIYPPARVKFSLTVKVGQTVCRNEPGVDLTSCRFQEPEKTMTCRFVVLAVPNSQIPSSLLEDRCS